MANIQVPSKIYSAVNPYAILLGVPTALWEYVVYQESSFDASVISSDGTSYGLFQLNVDGGQGASALYSITGYMGPYSESDKRKLLDPSINAKYGMPPCAAAWNKYKASYSNTVNWWVKFCSDSGHPGGSASDPVTLSYARTIQHNVAQNLFGDIIGNEPAPISTGGSSTIKIPPSTPGKKPWYQFARVDNIGVPDPYGGFPKPDSNVQVPAGYPLTALLPGTVTSVQHGLSFGAVVTIKFDSPPATNPKAQYYFYEHMRGDIQVNEGDHVYSSQIIGYNGSEQAEGAQKVPVGFGLYAGPIYGGGSAWNTTQAAITTTYNPVALLNSAANGTLAGLIDPSTGGNATASTGSSTGDTSGSGAPSSATYSSVLKQVHNTLVSNPGFYGVALAVDESEQFPGYIDLSNGSWTDVTGLMRSIGASISDNFVPFIVRSGLVLFGAILFILLLYKAVIER